MTTTTTSPPPEREELVPMDAVHAAERQSPPWRRTRSRLAQPGVLFSLIWQVFLAYPVLAVIAADAAAGWTVLGLVSIAAFSVTYVIAFASPAASSEDFPLEFRGRRADAEEISTSETGRGDGSARGALGLGYLAALVVCAFGTAPAAGPNAVVTFLPFLACFFAAAWSPRRSVPASSALVAAGVATALLVGEMTLLIPSLLVIPIVLSMIGTRFAVGLSEREGRLRRALGAAEERDRVGRDLHDVLGHTLTALTIRAQLADRLVDEDPESAHRELRTIEQLTRTALSEMRQTVSGLRTADPETELAGFTESLRSAGIDVRVRGGLELVPHRHSDLAAWTIREAGTNIIRHSGATRVVVEFATEGLRIRDDGVGLGPRHRGREASVDGSGGGGESGIEVSGVEGSGGGQGLAGLARRARGRGATVTASDAQGAGTIVEARWG